MGVNIKVVFGILGNISALLLFSSPIPTFFKIAKERTVGDYSGIPYVATLLNCMLWVLYGLPVVKFQVLVVSVNAAGALLALSFITLYFIYASKKMRMKVTQAFTIVVIAFIAMTVLVLKLVADHEKRKMVIGSLSVVFAVLMYVSPLTIIRMVIRTRSVKYMPFLLSVFMLVNGVMWTGYGFIGEIDVYLVIPNGLGALAAVAQLAVYAYYKNATPRKDLDDKGNPIMPEPTPL